MATSFLFQICSIMIININIYMYNIESYAQLYIILIYMISTCLSRVGRLAFQRWTPRFAMNHIKDMNE